MAKRLSRELLRHQERVERSEHRRRRRKILTTVTLEEVPIPEAYLPGMRKTKPLPKRFRKLQGVYGHLISAQKALEVGCPYPPKEGFSFIRYETEKFWGVVQVPDEFVRYRYGINTRLRARLGTL